MNGNNSGTTGKFYGKYRGVVVNNIDPQQMGRLLVRVSDVLGENPCIWASPASPVAGTQMGMYAVPPIGSKAWIEFENGDPNDAIWTGGVRGSSTDVPAEALNALPTNPPIVIQSMTQNRIIISSTPGEGLTLETAAGKMGPRIVIGATSITISCGPPPASSIEITASEVKINGIGLVVKAGV